MTETWINFSQVAAQGQGFQAFGWYINIQIQYLRNLRPSPSPEGLAAEGRRPAPRHLQGRDVRWTPLPLLDLRYKGKDRNDD